MLIMRKGDSMTAKQSKNAYYNILRRSKYEFNEERYLMANDLDLDKIFTHKDIVISYGRISNNNGKVNYWRNIDSVRYKSKFCSTSKNYHPYCGDTVGCSTCFVEASYIEADLLSKNIPFSQMREYQDQLFQYSPQYSDIENYPPYDAWVTLSGDICLFHRDKEHSLKLSDKAVEFDPCASTYWSCGEAYEMNYEFEKALRDYQTAWEYDPAYIYQIAKARVYMKLNQPDKASHEYCLAICDINQRCETSVMNYMRVFKYDLVKSRLLTWPPYLEPCKIQTLQDVSNLLEVHRNSLPEKDYISAKEILFWTMQMDSLGKLHDNLVQMPLCGFSPLQPYCPNVDQSSQHE